MLRPLSLAFACVIFSCSSPLFSHGGHHHDHDHDHEHDHMINLSEEQIAEAEITIEPVKGGYLIQQIKAPAKVVIPQQSIVQVVPNVSGIVTKIYKKIGDKVRKDEPIATLESREMAEAKANYIAAQKKQQLKQTIVEKERNLAAKKISPEIELWHAETAAEEAQIDAELARQRLLALGLHSDDIQKLLSQKLDGFRFYEVRSPISGTIVSTGIAPGGFVSTDKELVTIADLNQRVLEIDVPAPHQNLIKKGLSTSAKASHGDTCQSEINCFKPMLEESTRTLKAYAPINSEKHPWTPGTYVTAHIESDKSRFPLVIPKKAVQNIDGEEVVFVSNDHGFEIRHIHLGPSDNERIVVIDGLHKGEKIAVTNTFLLKAEHEKDEAEHEH